MTGTPEEIATKKERLEKALKAVTENHNDETVAEHRNALDAYNIAANPVGGIVEKAAVKDEAQAQVQKPAI